MNAPCPVDAPAVCWGEILWDLYPAERHLGGAPANVAFHLATLGEPSALISRVGEDELGRAAIAGFAARGVDVTGIQRDPGRATGRVEVTISDGDASYRLVPGCAWEYIAIDDDQGQDNGAARALLARAGSFCYGTLSQLRGTSRFDAALALLPEGCIKVCDVNLRPKYVDMASLRAALVAADVVKINDREAEILTDRFAVSEPIRWLQDEFGVAFVAETRGERGSALHTRDGVWEHPGFAATESGVPATPGGGDGDGRDRHRDNVGAGDGYTAVLTALLRRGRSPGEIVRAGNRYGAFIASRRGATPDVPEHVLRDTLGESR